MSLLKVNKALCFVGFPVSEVLEFLKQNDEMLILI